VHSTACKLHSSTNHTQHI